MIDFSKLVLSVCIFIQILYITWTMYSTRRACSALDKHVISPPLSLRLQHPSRQPEKENLTGICVQD